LPFGNIEYWSLLSKATHVALDMAEHFEKRSFRNRYYIAAAHGIQCLSLPLLAGRNQRAAMQDVKISYAENWRQQHWRSLYSSYNRAPYFEYYKDELEDFFLQRYEQLTDFNLASFEWIKNQLGLSFETTYLTAYKKIYPDTHDIRNIKPNDKNSNRFPHYYQVFEDRNGFTANLSVLDLLFNEGRYAAEYLKTQL